MTKTDRVLISTLPPTEGGVPTMTKYICSLLEKKDYSVSIAYYIPYSSIPDLSVPLWKLFYSKPFYRRTECFNGLPAFKIGAWLPELEFTHYYPTQIWKKLIKQHDYHIAVSGNVLTALPFTETNTPFLCWAATPYFEDKKDRRKAFPLPRRILDSVLNTPVCKYLEKKIIKSGRIVALSKYTKQNLESIARLHKDKLTVMPMPVDTDLFVPNEGNVELNTVGFFGRFNDKRKNIPLLIQAIRRCHELGYKLKLLLIGAKPSQKLIELVQSNQLQDYVEFKEYVERERLPAYYQKMGVFVIPSYQEGLGIVGLEAMACGCPVVSTRCGGPEEYVKDGVNGYLVDFDADDMANALMKILQSNEKRKQMSREARTTIIQDYDMQVVSSIFWREFNETFMTE